MKSILFAVLFTASFARAEPYFCLSSPQAPGVLFVMTAAVSDEEPVPRVNWALRYEGRIALTRITSSSWEAAVADATITHALNAASRAPEAERIFDASEEFASIELRRDSDKTIAVSAPLIPYSHYHHRRLEIRAAGLDRGEKSNLIIDGKPVTSIIYQHCGDD